MGPSESPESSFSSSAGFPPARAGDAPPLAAPASHKKASEVESIARRAAAPEITAKHLLAGCAQSNPDCISAVLDTPPEAFPGELEAVARAVHDLHATGAPVEVAGLYRTLDALEVQNPGVLLADLGAYASCAPDLDSRALLLDYAKRDSANKLALISEIAAGGDLEGARHAMADLAPFEFAPAPENPLPRADIEHAGEMPTPLFEGAVYRARLAVLVSESNAGKSMLSLTTALSLALGRQLLHALKPTAPGRSLILSGEDDRTVIAARLKAIATAHNILWNDVLEVLRNGRLSFVDATAPLIQYSLSAPPRLSESWRELQRVANDFDLVIIDPMSSWITLTAENGAVEQIDLAQRFTRLNRDSGAAILLLHHANKSGSGSLDQNAFRGSNAIPSASRWMANLAVPSVDQLERLGLTAGDRTTHVFFSESKNSYAARNARPYLLKRTDGGALLDAEDTYTKREGDIAEALALALGEAQAHLTRREIREGRGEVAKNIRERIKGICGGVTAGQVERAIVRGIALGLLKEEAATTAARRSRVEVLPNEQ